MTQAFLPFIVVPSPAVRNLLGRDLDKVAVRALKVLLERHRIIEVAHQQITYRKHHIAFSSRVGRYGDVIVELDIGDPKLAARLVPEWDLRRAEKVAAARRTDSRPGAPCKPW